MPLCFRYVVISASTSDMLQCSCGSFTLVIMHFLLHLLDVQMEKSDAYRKGSGSAKKWDGGGGGGPGGSGRGPYGGGPPRPPRGLDNVRGIDHSKFHFQMPLFSFHIIDRMYLVVWYFLFHSVDWIYVEFFSWNT